MRSRHQGLQAAATLLIALVIVSINAGSASAASTVQALYQMNEKSGTIAVDSSAPANNGMNYNIKFGVPGTSGTGYEFNGISSTVVVPTADNLNPGTRNFTVSAKVQFSAVPPPTTYDIVRKGLAGTRGGEFKLEIINYRGEARASCVAQGATTGTVTVTGTANLADGRWHSLQCSRSGSSWSVTVDGTKVSKQVTLGSISNTKDLVIGSKYREDDFYKGVMDEVRLAIG